VQTLQCLQDFAGIRSSNQLKATRLAFLGSFNAPQDLQKVTYGCAVHAAFEQDKRRANELLFEQYVKYTTC